jgi:S-DNA-T family DNA segregation ATPase FtsK/SpoIIIE
LIAGQTGSGKTELLRTMLWSLALWNLERQLMYVLIDPKGGMALDAFAGLPHLALPLARNENEAVRALRHVVELMVQRSRRKESRPAVVMVIDELADLCQMGGATVVDAITRLVQRGREAGIHVIAATQKPTAAITGTLAKANFPTRICGKVASAADANVAMGIPGSGAERLMGYGDFLMRAGGVEARFQAAYKPEREIVLACESLGWRYAPQWPQTEKREPAPVENVKDAEDELDQYVQKLRPFYLENRWRFDEDAWGWQTKAVRYLFGDEVKNAGWYHDRTVAALDVLKGEDTGGAE